MAFKGDLEMVDWNVALALSEENLNVSCKSFLKTVDRLIGKHYPKKPIPKQNFNKKKI